MRARVLLKPLVCSAAALALASPALAQQVYRIVGPDGRISFSDQPPATSTPATAAGATASRSSEGPNPPLPYELRQVVAKFPVTLYTTKTCPPCDQARALLAQRGVPYTEKTVTSADDVQALQRLSGGSSLPFGTIGAQAMKGFAEVEWRQTLDLAGYPKTSQLPRNYRQAEPTPLVATKVAEPPSPAPTSPPPPPVAAPAPLPAVNPNPGNPAGIRF